MAASLEAFLEQTAQTDVQMGVEPFFMHATTENVRQSELQKTKIMQTDEYVQIRLPGDTRYAPVYPALAMWYRFNGTVITYAERFSKQYQAYLSGEDQKTMGTPLDMLNAYGMTPEFISFCRANKIYSVEALDSLEGQNLKNLGMRANRLKEMAAAFMADRAKGANSANEIAELKAKLALLEQSSIKLPIDQFDGFTQEQVERLTIMSDDDIKEAIATKVGRKPAGNPNRATLERTLVDAERDAA